MDNDYILPRGDNERDVCVCVCGGATRQSIYYVLCLHVICECGYICQNVARTICDCCAASPFYNFQITIDALAHSARHRHVSKYRYVHGLLCANTRKTFTRFGVVLCVFTLLRNRRPSSHDARRAPCVRHKSMPITYATRARVCHSIDRAPRVPHRELAIIAVLPEQNMRSPWNNHLCAPPAQSPPVAAAAIDE